MTRKQDNIKDWKVPLTTYVSEDERDAFQELARAEHRTAAAELRRLVEMRLAEHEEEVAA